MPGGAAPPGCGQRGGARWADVLAQPRPGTGTGAGTGAWAAAGRRLPSKSRLCSERRLRRPGRSRGVPAELGPGALPAGSRRCVPSSITPCRCPSARRVRPGRAARPSPVTGAGGRQRAREPAVPGTPGAGCPRRAPIGRGAGRAARSGPISGQYCPGGARGRCRSGAARAGMDLGYISIGLCRGVPVPPCPRRGPGSFPPPDIAAPPPPPACAGCAAVPCPGYERPRGAGTPGERCRDPPRPDDSGTRRPTPPEFGRPRPRPGSPTPGTAPAAPRTFEWMRVKRSPSGRSEWGRRAREGAAPIRAPLCPSPAPTLAPQSRSLPPPPPR